jgi:hypothetical protein
MRRLFLTALLLALLPTYTAQSDPGLPTIMGVGTASCGEWTKARANPDLETLALLSWAGGYLSAYKRVCLPA